MMDNYKGKKVILISVLPGLGKSTTAENTPGVIDYEDWMEEKGMKYKEEINAYEHINTMLRESENDGLDLIVFSSIHWESMNDKTIQSSLVIHMNTGEYNCKELDFRGRRDLCDKHKDELHQWNEDYKPLARVRKSYLLEKGKFMDLKALRAGGYFEDYYEVANNNRVIK